MELKLCIFPLCNKIPSQQLKFLRHCFQSYFIRRRSSEENAFILTEFAIVRIFPSYICEWVSTTEYFKCHLMQSNKSFKTYKSFPFVKNMNVCLRSFGFSADPQCFWNKIIKIILWKLWRIVLFFYRVHAAGSTRFIFIHFALKYALKHCISNISYAIIYC